MLALCGLLLLAVGCGSESSEPVRSVASTPAVDPSQIITLGDIEPDEPVKKINRFTPLADYLARHLSEFGITEGRVAIAKDVDEMASLMADGRVDIYFDSPFPAVAIRDLIGSDIILRRWKDGNATYWSTYISLKGSGVTGVEDLVGRIVAFEQPHSTSGFIMPAGALIQRGFVLREVGGPDADVSADEIGYFFSRDEQNTVEFVLTGQVAGGGISSEDYDELPEEYRDRLVVFDRTAKLPRQVVSVRPELDAGLVAKVRELLIGLDKTAEGLEILEGLKKTKKFDPLPPDSEAVFEEVRELSKLVSGM